MFTAADIFRLTMEDLLSISLLEIPRVNTLRMGWGKAPRAGVAISGEPMCLNGKIYRYGLGDHTQSCHDIVLPGSGKSFEAFVGVQDGNLTRNMNDAVVFRVEISGEKVWESRPLRRTDAPERLNVALRGARSFTIKAINTSCPEEYSGCPSCSHANWAQPKIVLEDGRNYFMGDGTTIQSILPDFNYDGSPANFRAWRKTIQGLADTDEYSAYRIQFDAPDGLLRLKLTAKIYKDFPVVEWLPELIGIGDGSSGIVDDFRSLSLTAITPCEEIVIRRTTGAKSSLSDFVKHPVTLKRRHGFNHLSLDTDEGASSAAWMPFFGLDLSALHGVEVGIGWTGAWKADFVNRETVSLSAGMMKTHFHVLPGECIRQPSILLFMRDGITVGEAGKQFRRFMIQNKSPRDSLGKLFDASLSVMTGGGNKSDATMLRMVDLVKKNHFPVDTFWVDAGWYGPAMTVDENLHCGGWDIWYEGAGDWRINTVIHPDGNFKKVSLAAEDAGMKFMLWFEIERAIKGTPVTLAHPEFFFASPENVSVEKDGMLLNLGKKEARDWAVNTVSDMIRKNNIGCYRQDFNITTHAGNIWRHNDTNDRIGIAEAKHIAGLYEFWDTLRARFPDMLIDNCASGGRRLDFEMLSRSHCYASDDIIEDKTCPEVSQNIISNTINYVPFQCGLTSTGTFMDDYNFMSYIASATELSLARWGFLERDFSDSEIKWLHKMLNHAVRFREFFKGDFYLLTDNPADNRSWCAYQCDRDDLGEGFIIAFRREFCPSSEIVVEPVNIDPLSEYQLNFFDDTACRISGRQLVPYKITLNEARTFQLCYYKKILNG